MIVILALFLTTVFANSQDKYIDLLPDGEKQKFLNNVARRILESVESYGTNKGSRELSDEQLKKHNSYVQSIMEQETAAFEARRNKREDRSSEDNDDSKEDLEEKPFKFRGDDVDKSDTDMDMDFSVTGNKRRSNAETPQDNLTDTSETNNIKEDTLSLPLQSIKTDVNSVETSEISTIKISKEEENENSQETSTLNSNLVDSTTKTDDFEIETTTMLATDFENNFTLETSAVTSSSPEVDNVSTETTSGSNIQILEYDSTTSSNSIYVITERNDQLNSKAISETTEPFPLESSSLTDKSTIDSNSNTVDSTINNQAFTTTTGNTVDENTATTENYSAVTDDPAVKERLETVTETVTFSPLLTTTSLKEEQSTRNPKDIISSKTIKQTENETLVSYVASKALNSIKHELEMKEKGESIDNEVKTTNIGNTHLNHYQVYEIHWPIKNINQLFIRSQDPMKDQPHYVPVFKYSQNFAYNNSNNHLGPNEVENNSNEIETRNLSERNNDTHDNAEPSESKLQSKNKMRKFINMLLFDPTATTTVRTTKMETPPWDLFLNPFGNNEYRLSTTRHIPRTTTKYRSTRRTSTRVPRFKIVKNNYTGWVPKVPIKSPIMKKRIQEKDMFIHLAKLHALKLQLMRSKTDSKVNIYLNVLKDLILEDSKSLKQYDWLTTTVQIQSAVTKILKLIKRIRESEELHPADLQILRYIVFLHNFSLKEIEGNKLGKGVKLLPQNKSLKEENVVNGDWVFLRKAQPDLEEDDGINDLHELLTDVQDGLFDLHESIRQIAGVTRFDRQNWYDNLKQLYLSADEKHLRELLLHISMSRLVDLVEHSCQQGRDNNFIQFVKTNKKDAKRIVEEIMFINDIVHEITTNKV